MPRQSWMAHLACVMIAILLPACGTTRPPEPRGALQCGLERNGLLVSNIAEGWARSEYSIKSRDGSDPSFNVLALSAGGEFGAYGAGFLYGWGQVPNAHPIGRSDIHVVTGVSTGAILATHAFLEEDLYVKKLYENLSAHAIYRERWRFELLWANSVLDTARKDELIEERLGAEVIQLVADNKAGRFLYIGMVDFDSGRFLIVDMVKLARTLKSPLREQCYQAVIGASSAIPIAFAPKFIDGMMLVDGAARRHLFIGGRLPGEAMKPNVKRRLFALVHGDLNVGCDDKTPNGLIGIVERTAEVATDQALKNSIFEMERLAATRVAGGEDRLFATYYASAAGAAFRCRREQLEKCPDPDGSFCNAFMKCLSREGAEEGEGVARRERRWFTVNQLGSPDRKCENGRTKRRLSQ